MRKQSYFHIPEFSQMGLTEHEFLGILLGVTHKCFCGQSNLENTELTEITFVMCFSSL